jgi:hypothetical protein
VQANLHLARKSYAVDRATAALERLIADSRFTLRAAEVATEMQREDGLSSACNAIKSVWN